VADGVVKATNPEFTKCEGSWAGNILVYHPSLDHTINYGEINTDSILVQAGQQVEAGAYLGNATVCGMLHLEAYQGKVARTKRWNPPRGQKVHKQPHYCTQNRYYARTTAADQSPSHHACRNEAL
jgi:hypothetical protein